MRNITVIIACVCAVHLMAACGEDTPPPAAPAPGGNDDFKSVYLDEFDGAFRSSVWQLTESCPGGESARVGFSDFKLVSCANEMDATSWLRSRAEWRLDESDEYRVTFDITTGDCTDPFARLEFGVSGIMEDQSEQTTRFVAATPHPPGSIWIGAGVDLQWGLGGRRPPPVGWHWAVTADSRPREVCYEKHVYALTFTRDYVQAFIDGALFLEAERTETVAPVTSFRVFVMALSQDDANEVFIDRIVLEHRTIK